MIRKLLTLAILSVLFGGAAQAQQTFNLFRPSNGILVGQNNTYVTTAAAASNVISLWSGTCNATTFLRGDGQCVAAGGGGSTPGGSDGQLQYNNAGAFGGIPAIWSAGTDTLTFSPNGGIVIERSGNPALVQINSTGTDSALIQLNNAGSFATVCLQDSAGSCYANGTQGDLSLIPSFGRNVNLGGPLAVGGTDSMTFVTNSVTRFAIDDDGSWDLAGSAGSATQVLTSNGAGSPPTWAAAGGGGTPGGSTTQVQFNNAGAFGGDADWTWVLATNIMTVGTQPTPATIQGGTGSATNGALITFRGGQGGTTNNGGAAILQGGLGGATSGNGGSVNVLGGVPTDGNGGAVTIQGNAGVGTNRNGGSISMSAGSPTGSGSGGSVNITAGSIASAAQAAAVTVSGGSAGTLGTSGGQATLSGGSGGTVGNGGNVQVNAAAGGSTSGNGGLVTVSGGAGTASNGNGGQISINGGNAIGTGTGGTVQVTAGTSPSGTAGSVTLRTGAASTTRLQIDPAGAWLVGGSAGTAGDIITSAGAGAPPTWQLAPVTAATLIPRSVSVTDNTVAGDCGKVILFTGAGSQTFTLDSDPPVNCVLTIVNAGTGSLSVAATALSWYNGSGTIGTGTRTLAVAGVMTATVFSTLGSWSVWGSGVL